MCETLQASKITSEAVTEQLIVVESTEVVSEEARNKFKPVDVCPMIAFTLASSAAFTLASSAAFIASSTSLSTLAAAALAATIAAVARFTLLAAFSFVCLAVAAVILSLLFLLCFSSQSLSRLHGFSGLSGDAAFFIFFNCCSS